MQRQAMAWLALILVPVLLVGFHSRHPSQVQTVSAGVSTVSFPLYPGLQHDSGQHYLLRGSHCREINFYYGERLPQKGWRLISEQVHPDWTVAKWRNPHTGQELRIDTSYVPGRKSTEVIFALHPGD